MDIDDLLAEVSVDATAEETRDWQELTRCWVAERVAPALLPWPSALLERVLDRIRRQIELVEDQTGNMDPKTNFTLIILQTELERCKFLVRSFLRARLKKIDAHPLHIQEQHVASVASLQPLLSSSEYQYLGSHQSLVSAHYASAFLAQFPPSLQRIDDTTGGISMIDQPDEDKAVFVRVLRDIGTMVVEGTDRRFEMKRGDIWVVRWSAIRAWAVGSGTGDVELI